MRRRKSSERPEGAASFPLLHDPFGDLRPPSPHEAQPDPQIRPLGGALDPAPVHVGQEGLDAVAAGVPAQGVQGVEAHGLVVEEPDVVLDRVVVPEPGRLIGQQAEGGGVGLGEAELAETP